MLGASLSRRGALRRGTTTAMGYVQRRRSAPEAMRRLGTLFSKGWSGGPDGGMAAPSRRGSSDAVAWYEQGKVALDGRMPPRDRPWP